MSDSYRTSLKSRREKNDVFLNRLLYFDYKKLPKDFLGILTRIIEKYGESAEKVVEETDGIPLTFTVTKVHINYLKSILRYEPKIYQDLKNVINPIENIIVCLNYPGNKIPFHFEIIQILLKYGANPNSAVSYNYIIMRVLHLYVGRAISDAQKEKFLELVTVLLKYGAITETDLGELRPKIPVTTPFYCAMLMRNVELAKCIFLHGAIVNIECLISRNIVDKSDSPLLHQLVNQELNNSCFNLPTDLNVERICKLYKEMGGNLLAVDHKSQNIFQSFDLFRGKGLESREDWLKVFLEEKIASRKAELTDCLTELLAAPLSLQSLSRLAVVKAMGRGCWDNIDRLPLPTDLKKVLRFEYD